MGDNTNIEWTDATWNPVTGCSKVSPGCDHCYMFRQWPRLHGMGVRGYEGSPGRPALQLHRLEEPLSWKKPRRVFVCSMSDLFHPDIPFDYILRVFEVMADAKRHTFQVLTKRPGRMMHFANKVLPEFGEAAYRWPGNVWAGTSLEMMADGNKLLWKRLALLARVPAKVRFVSAEPLLGPLDLRPWLGLECALPGCGRPKGLHWEDAPLLALSPPDHPFQGLSWVIAGGESGPGARPMHPDWVRSLRDQCQAAGVPFHFKQWGEWHPSVTQRGASADWKPVTKDDAVQRLHIWSDEELSIRIGKKAAGAVLDGREHREFPQEHPVTLSSQA